MIIAENFRICASGIALYQYRACRRRSWIDTLSRHASPEFTLIFYKNKPTTLGHFESKPIQSRLNCSPPEESIFLGLFYSGSFGFLRLRLMTAAHLTVCARDPFVYVHCLRLKQRFLFSFVDGRILKQSKWIFNRISTRNCIGKTRQRLLHKPCTLLLDGI